MSGGGGKTDRELWLEVEGGRSVVAQNVIKGIREVLRQYDYETTASHYAINGSTTFAALHLQGKKGTIDFRRSLALRAVYREVWEPQDDGFDEPHAPRDFSDGLLRFFGHPLTTVDALVDRYVDWHVVDFDDGPDHERPWTEPEHPPVAPPTSTDELPAAAPGSRQAFVLALGGRAVIAGVVIWMLREAYHEFGDRRIDWGTAPITEDSPLIAPEKQMTLRTAFTYAWFFDRFFEGTRFAAIDELHPRTRRALLAEFEQPLRTVRDLVDCVIDRCVATKEWQSGRKRIWELTELPDPLQEYAYTRNPEDNAGDTVEDLVEELVAQDSEDDGDTGEDPMPW